MHDTALMSAKAFFETYAPDAKSVLDVGSLDVNGTIRPIIPEGASYYGMDVVAGPNVNVIHDDPDRFPFESKSFDVVCSTSCLEHDPMFWLTFREMVRVAQRFVYISAPVDGVVHRHPVDCWRFFPDAGRALETWARHCGYVDTRLVESMIVPPRDDIWHDFVAVFSMNNRVELPKKFLCEVLPGVRDVLQQ